MFFVLVHISVTNLDHFLVLCCCSYLIFCFFSQGVRGILISGSLLPETTVSFSFVVSFFSLIVIFRITTPPIERSGLFMVIPSQRHPQLTLPRQVPSQPLLSSDASSGHCLSFILSLCIRFPFGCDSSFPCILDRITMDNAETTEPRLYLYLLSQSKTISSVLQNMPATELGVTRGLFSGHHDIQTFNRITSSEYPQL